MFSFFLIRVSNFDKWGGAEEIVHFISLAYYNDPYIHMIV